MAKTVLSAKEKSILHSMFLRSHLVFTAFTMVKMEANAFTISMAPAIEDLYKDDPQGKIEAYRRHQNFFNTHAVPLSFIVGLSYAMEKEHVENGSVDGKTIESIKAALMGPTAGMFDSIFFNCLRVIAAGIAIGLCSEGNILGTLIFILLYGVTQSITKYYFVNWGYIYGTSFIDTVFSSGLMNALIKSASVLGLMMVGAMSASFVNVPLNWVISVGQTSVNVGEIFDSIFPGLLGIMLLFFLIWLIKKGARPTQLVLGILAFGLLGALIHIF
ncbi:MAG: PTS system mannose/fructose/sorbose family transporter subunit IID [Erysipelotrichaceae bacterium]|jgi:PTS system mannose-specific IID component|nr:PTS system mannose/fructose/sorbose family transporter subunit IID [Erysipelotrichaceae bacterium]